MGRGKAVWIPLILLAALDAHAGQDRPQKARGRRVWADKLTNTLGEPSPDGKYLSFTDWETGDLAIRDLTTGVNYRLTNKGSWQESGEYAYFSVFSPDSRQVAYAWFNEKKFYEVRIVAIEDARPPLLAPLPQPGLNRPSEAVIAGPSIGEIYKAGVTSSKPRVLFRSDDVQFIKPSSWSADGKYILALFFGKKILNQIVLISVADGSVRVLKSPFWIYPKKMNFAPDGRHIVYSLNQHPPQLPHDIFVMSTDGATDAPIVEHPANDVFCVWAPDGRNIVFASNRDGTLDLWNIQVDGPRAVGEPALLKRDLGRFLPLGFTRAGGFFYGLRTGVEDAYAATLDPATGGVLEQPKPVSTQLEGLNRSPDWSPDGTQLAFLSRVDTENLGLEMRVVAVRSVATGEERQFGVPKLGYLEWLRWAPDGKSFLVGGSDTNNNQGGLYRIDAGTGRVTTVVQDEFAPPRGWEGAWSHDGSAVYYLREDMRERATSIRFLRLDNAEEEVLHHSSGSWRHLAMALSPDGRTLAFILGDGNARMGRLLAIMPAGGGTTRELLRTRKSELSGLAWTKDGNHLLFSRAGKDTPELWTIAVAGGQARSLGLAAGENTRISVHPDGRRFAYTAGQTNTEIWALENFLPPVTVSGR